MAEPVRPPPPAAATRLNPVNPAKRRNQDHQWKTEGSEARQPTTPSARKTAETGSRSSAQADRWIKAKALLPSAGCCSADRTAAASRSRWRMTRAAEMRAAEKGRQPTVASRYIADRMHTSASNLFMASAANICTD